MEVVIEIPENEIPNVQEIISMNLHFIHKEVCECTYPFKVLPEHHGRLIDADVLVDGMEDDYEFCEAVNATPTIIPATKEERKCTDCKWYGFTCECPVHCTQDTKIAWESATKEGDG